MGRILGLDVGDRTIGVAVSDELGITAQGVGVHQRGSWAADLTYLRELLKQFDPAAIVVGLPKNMDGSLGPQAQKALAFIDRLRRACSIPVTAWDERLTTRQAERILLAGDVSRRRRKQVRDRLAAQLILQTYLEWRSQQSHPDRSDMRSIPQDAGGDTQDGEMRQPNTSQ